MYRHAKFVDWCQCCQQRVAFSNLEGSSDFFRNHNSPQIVHASYDNCCFHISISFYSSKSLLLEEKVARRSRDGCGVAATAFTPHQSASLTASPQGEALLRLQLFYKLRCYYYIKGRSPLVRGPSEDFALSGGERFFIFPVCETASANFPTRCSQPPRK